MNGGHLVTLRSSVTVLAAAVLLFALSGGVWLPELAAMIATGLAAVLAAAGVLFFAVWLT
jgi:hypothetical protein